MSSRPNQMPADAAATSADDDPLVAGVELGGTKAIAVLGHGRTIVDRISVATTTPTATLGALAARLSAWRDEHRPRALGIASFGPVAIDPAGERYGHVLPTPKPGWAGADVFGPLAAAIDAPTAIHTDVSAAALAEGCWGGARGLDDFVYVTIGTGIGMGVVAGGRPVAGRMHPEVGHLLVRRIPGDGFVGACPFHGDCLEGLAAGPAIAVRAGKAAERLEADDPAWSFVADALAAAFVSLLLTTAPAAILIGGGVGIGQQHLLPRVRLGVVEKLAGYLPFVDATTIDTIIRPAELGGEAGPLGALRLAAGVLS